MNGNFSSRDVSYISFAHSQFQERCLSLNTGTARPLVSKDLHDLLEELVARILGLSLFVALDTGRARRPAARRPRPACSARA